MIATADVMITDKSGAEALVDRATASLDQLLEIIMRETRLVREGRLVEVADLEEEKAQLVRSYAQMMDAIRGYRELLSRFAPAAVDRLRKRHLLFRAELQINMAALATARAVSESLVQGVADSVTRQRRPQAYTAKGGMQRARPENAGGIAVDKAL